MLTIEEIRKRLEDRNVRLVAERAKVPYNVVLRVARGTTQNPTYNTTKALSEYLEGNQ